MMTKEYPITYENKMETYSGILLERSGNTIRKSQSILTNRIIQVIPGIKKVNPVNYLA